MDVGLIVVLLIGAVINVVLFIKLWIMANDVKGIHNLIFAKEALSRGEGNSQAFLEARLKGTINRELSRHN